MNYIKKTNKIFWLCALVNLLVPNFSYANQCPQLLSSKSTVKQLVDALASAYFDQGSQKKLEKEISDLIERLDLSYATRLAYRDNINQIKLRLVELENEGIISKDGLLNLYIYKLENSIFIPKTNRVEDIYKNENPQKRDQIVKALGLKESESTEFQIDLPSSLKPNSVDPVEGMPHSFKISLKLQSDGRISIEYSFGNKDQAELIWFRFIDLIHPKSEVQNLEKQFGIIRNSEETDHYIFFDTSLLNVEINMTTKTVSLSAKLYGPDINVPYLFISKISEVDGTIRRVDP